MLATAVSAQVATSRFLYCGLVAGPSFVFAFLVEGWTRGDGYDPMRHPVSSLALGDHGWTQTVNFLVCGVLTVLFATGLWRSGVGRAGAVLVGVWGVGLIGAGAFRTDPVSGYPLGTPDALDYTTLGTLHDGFSLPAFLALALAQVVLARGRGWRWFTYSLLSATTFIVFFLFAGQGFSQAESLVDMAGLFQRVSVIVGWTWTVVLAVRLLSRRAAWTVSKVAIIAMRMNRAPIGLVRREEQSACRVGIHRCRGRDGRGAPGAVLVSSTAEFGLCHVRPTWLVGSRN